jgi:hypothetical protein
MELGGFYQEGEGLSTIMPELVDGGPGGGEEVEGNAGSA